MGRRAVVATQHRDDLRLSWQKSRQITDCWGLGKLRESSNVAKCRARAIVLTTIVHKVVVVVDIGRVGLVVWGRLELSEVGAELTALGCKSKLVPLVVAQLVLGNGVGQVATFSRNQLTRQWQVLCGAFNCNCIGRLVVAVAAAGGEADIQQKVTPGEPSY